MNELSTPGATPGLINRRALLTSALAALPVAAMAQPQQGLAERHKPTVRPFRIYDGASEVHRAAIAKRVFAKGLAA